MDSDVSRRYAKGLPFALLIGAVVFFLAGPWVVETLLDYGFSWSQDAGQQLAWLVAGLVSLPTSLIVDPSQPSRFLLAINGVVWGAVVYSGWMLAVSIGQSLRRS